MTASFGPPDGLFTTAGANRRVTIGDVEQQLRSLGGSAQSALSSTGQNAKTAGVFAAVLLVGLSYLLGRRRGKRRASVLEIRRV